MLGCNGYMKATTTLICVGISIANPKKLVFTILHTHMIQWKHSKQIQCNQHNKFHSDVLQKHKYDNIIILKIEFLVQGLVDMFKIWDDILYLTFMLIVIQWTILHCPSFKLLKKLFSNVSTLNYAPNHNIAYVLGTQYEELHPIFVLVLWSQIACLPKKWYFIWQISIWSVTLHETQYIL